MSHVPRFRTSVERSPAGAGIDAWTCANRNTWLRMRLFIRLPLAPSPDHLVSTEQDRLGDLDAKGFGSLEVDDEFELRWLFDRQVARVRTFQDLVDVPERPEEHVA